MSSGGFYKVNVDSAPVLVLSLWLLWKIQEHCAILESWPRRVSVQVRADCLPPKVFQVAVGDLLLYKLPTACGAGLSA